ncbi:MAG: winged helix-turn-helix transcriptional regulator [Candidatus Hodarchaeota archaeon]
MTIVSSLEIQYSEELKNLKIEISLLRAAINQLNERLETLINSSFDKITTKAKRATVKNSTNVKACQQTLTVIKQFELDYNRGATVKEIAKLRGLSPPTIYAHLEELEVSDLITSQRGSAIGLTPANSNFYYTTERDPTCTLWDLNYFASLSEPAQQVGLKLKAAHSTHLNGLSLAEIKEGLSFSDEEIEQAIQELLRRLLIDVGIYNLKKHYFVSKCNLES